MWQIYDFRYTVHTELLSFIHSIDVRHMWAVKLGIGGFSMGAAVALHSAACYAHGKFTSGIPYPITLNAVISLSGWLPSSRSNFDILSIDHLCHKTC